MKKYYRIMLGQKSAFAKEALAGGFVGTDFGIHQDLSGDLPDSWRAFNEKFIPIFLTGRPEKSRIAAGLACGAIWTVSKGMLEGDVVISPDGSGRYRVGQVIGDYRYEAGGVLPHRRQVQWLEQTIDRADMSEALKHSTGSIGTVSAISGHAEELERLIGGTPIPTVVSTDTEVEDPAAFVMEAHLEDFLVENWANTDLGKEFDIFEEDGDRVGQQYMTDTGPLDILAISMDKKSLLVVELKKGRASDVVVGQTLRYMGFVQEVLAEPGQNVRGAIVAYEDDQRIRRALAMAPSIAFYRYEVSFKLRRA